MGAGWIGAGGPTPLANKALGTTPTVESMCWGWGGWIGKQQAGPYVSLCHKDPSAYLPWQTGLPKTINLARFIKIKHWPPTSPLGVRQMPRSNSIDLECSLFHFWKESKAWISLAWTNCNHCVMVTVLIKQDEFTFSPTFNGEAGRSSLSAAERKRNASVLLLFFLPSACSSVGLGRKRQKSRLLIFCCLSPDIWEFSSSESGSANGWKS